MAARFEVILLRCALVGFDPSPRTPECLRAKIWLNKAADVAGVHMARCCEEVEGLWVTKKAT